MPENQEVLHLWQSIRTQWRAAGFGLVGLDYPAVRGEAEKIGINTDTCNWRKIQALERCELKIQSEGTGNGSKDSSKGDR